MLSFDASSFSLFAALRATVALVNISGDPASF